MFLLIYSFEGDGENSLSCKEICHLEMIFFIVKLTCAYTQWYLFSGLVILGKFVLILLLLADMIVSSGIQCMQKVSLECAPCLQKLLLILLCKQGL